MRKLTIFLCILLIAGHLLTETGTVAWLLDRSNYKLSHIHPFLSPYYTWYDPKGIDFYWWLKYVTTDLLFCIVFFVLAKVAAQYSFKLFLIGLIWFLYHVFDFVMLLWNFKTSYWLYAVTYVAISACIVCLFLSERKQGVVKSLN